MTSSHPFVGVTPAISPGEVFEWLRLDGRHSRLGLKLPACSTTKPNLLKQAQCHSQFDNSAVLRITDNRLLYGSSLAMGRLSREQPVEGTSCM